MSITLPSWHRAYMLFRFGDGLTHALIPLMPLLRYDLPLWSVPAIVAAMNLVTVPATFLWGSLMEKYRGHGRRRLAIGGFGASTLALIVMMVGPPLWLFAVAAMAFVAFGVATAPAASVLLLESTASKDWARATGLMAQRTGYAYVAGLMATMITGLTGELVPTTMFAVAAAATFAATGFAQRTIRPAEGPTMPEKPAPVTMASVRAGQRLFERTVFFPGRLRFRPTFKGITLANGDPLKFLIGIFLLFAGSAVFFSGYPGVLRETLGLSLGLVLLAQMPSNFTTPFVHPWAGRYGSEFGEIRATRLGALLRAGALPAMAIVLLFWPPGGLMLLLVLHGVVGVSFALLQSNGSCLMAKVHRAGRGQGVGNYHAAVSLGGLVGSVVATGMMVFLPLWMVYVVVAATLAVGTGLLVSLQGSNQFEPRNA